MFKKKSIEVTYFNIIRVIYYPSKVIIVLSGENSKTFPLNSETRQGCSLSPLLFNIVPEFLTTAIRQEKIK